MTVKNINADLWVYLIAIVVKLCTYLLLKVLVEYNYLSYRDAPSFGAIWMGLPLDRILHDVLDFFTLIPSYKNDFFA